MPKGDNRKGATFSADGKMKLCRGTLHRQGVYLPLHRYFKLKSGRRAGQLMSECSDCWRRRQGTDYSVSVQSVLPIIDRLVEECGSAEAVCARIGVSRNQISVVKRQQRVRGKFVEKLKKLDAEIQREKREKWLNQMEPEVVESEPLGSVLRNFCVEWLNDRPKGYGDYLGPVDFLSQKSGLSTKLVSRICNSEKQFVFLSQADSLLTAIQRVEMLTNGEIKVIPNPTWSLEAYMAYMKDRGCV